MMPLSRNRSGRLLIAAAFLAVLAAARLDAATCESLKGLSLPGATVTLSESVAARAFVIPGGRGGAPADLPAFCRAAATLRPAPGSEIQIEVWMPASGWNGKFQGIGNNGWGGSINYAGMSDALRAGYATSSTDTGHTGANGSFAAGQPEKLVDFGYRAIHEMTVKAKALIAEFYGSAARFSYFNGCAAAGRQALMEAQRYPEDYEGIIAGDAANPRTRFSASAVWVAHAGLMTPGSHIPAEKYPAIHQAVVGACDAIDGLKDGLIDDPRQCKFDPRTIACGGADNMSCLTGPQVETMRKILSPAVNPRTGEEIFPGLQPGSELGWNALGGPQPLGPALDQFRYVVFQDPNWDWKTFDFDSHVALADKVDNGIINAGTDISAFARRGKLLMYHGWSDPNVAPMASVNYHEKAADAAGRAQASNWIRLFMAPGMGHCSGGDGPNTFDAVVALDQWVAEGKAPDRIVASHSTAGKVDRTRPLCPYPQVARHTGTGSIDDAANFVCRMP